MKLSKVKSAEKSIMHQVHGTKHPIHGAPAAPSSEKVKQNQVKSCKKLSRVKLRLSKVKSGGQSLMHQVYRTMHVIHGAPAAPSNEKVKQNQVKSCKKSSYPGPN